MAVKTQTETQIEIPRIELNRLNVRVIGDSPLIVHKWSDKSKKQMLDKMLKVATKGREPKDPEGEFEASIYRDKEGRPVFPSIAFKSAIVSACRFLDDLKMTVVRGGLHINAEYVLLEGDAPIMREDTVRVGMGTSDLRYRGEFTHWSAMLPIVHNTRVLSVAQVVNLVNLAGFGVGCGEWRPERNGQYGRFHVQMENEA
jgi:hypothetical protein